MTTLAGANGPLDGEDDMHMGSPIQLLLIAIVVLVLFGRGKIAGMMGEFGKGITAFKKGIKEGSEEIEKAAAEEAKDVTPKDKV
jgi:sec-independent protein translocase protein TatA